jgi:hypothetical protein
VIGLLAACTEPAPPGSEPQGALFAVLEDRIEGGTLLGAWSDGEQMRMVGGQLDLDGTGAGSLATWDGQRVSAEPDAAPATLWWIHGPRPGEWYAVGAHGVVLHEVDGERADESVPTDATLFGVWAAQDGRVWAVGGDVRAGTGEVWLREQGAWRALHTALPGTLFKIWEDLVVGDGVAYRLEGEDLVPLALPSGEKLLTLRGRAPDDVYAVGGTSSPVLLRWDGLAWSDIPVDLQCTSQPLNGVWTAPGQDVWLAGNAGAMIRYDGAAFSCEVPPVTWEHFHAAWGHQGEVLFVGGNLFSPGDNYGTLGGYAR